MMTNYYAVKWGNQVRVCYTLDSAWDEYESACLYSEFVELLFIQNGETTVVSQSW